MISFDFFNQAGCRRGIAASLWGAAGYEAVSAVGHFVVGYQPTTTHAKKSPQPWMR